jgi:HK97 family phage portal protein
MKLKDIFSSKAKSITSENDAIVWQSFNGDSVNRTSAANLLDANKNWVFACTHKISRSAAGVNLRLMKSGKNGVEEEIFDHEALNILYRPNEYMDGKFLKYLTFAYYELTGNAYWLKKVDGTKISFIPLNPRNVTPVISKDGFSIVKYKYLAGSINTEYQPENILHWRMPNPNSFLIGKGVVEGVGEWIDVDSYATEFNLKFFVNGAKLGGMIESEATSKEALELIKLGIDTAHRGVSNAHKMGVLPKGAKYVESNMTPKDMEFSEADNRFRDKILAAFGVPKSVLGIVEDVNRASAEASNYVFQAFTIKPLAEDFADFLTEFYLPLFKRTEGFYFKADDPTPENSELNIKADQAGLANAPYMTVNEVRTRHGLPPITGGDSVYGNPFLEPVGTVENQKTVKAKTIHRKHVVDLDKMSNDIADKVVNTFVTKEEENIKALYEERHKQFVVRVNHYEDALRQELIKHDRKQEQEVISNLSKVVKSVSARSLLDETSAVGAIIDFTTIIMSQLTAEEGKQAMKYLGIQQEYESNSERLKKIVERSVKKMAESYTDTTIRKLSARLAQGINEGKTIEQIKEDISKVYDFTEEYRARAVARTEVFSAANDASREAYIQSGIVEKIVWHTAEDELTCEFCGPLDNKTVGITESFFKKGDTVQGSDGGEYDTDYERVQNPPLHPNCRCFIQPEKKSLRSYNPEHKQEEDRKDNLINDLVTNLLK